MLEASGVNRFVVELGAGHSVGFADLRQAMAMARFAERRKLGWRIWLIAADGSRTADGMQLLASGKSTDGTPALTSTPVASSGLWAPGTLHEKS